MFSIISKAKTCSMCLKELRLESADAKPWGRSPSRWTPCWTGRAARGFSPMSPACWPKERAEFSVTRGSRSLAQRLSDETLPHSTSTLNQHHRGLLTTYEIMSLQSGYLHCFCAQWSTPTTSLSTTQKYTPHTQKQTSQLPSKSLPTQALYFSITSHTKRTGSIWFQHRHHLTHQQQEHKHHYHSHKPLEGFLYCAAPEPTEDDSPERLANGKEGKEQRVEKKG